MSVTAPALVDNAVPTVGLMGLDVAAVSERDTINYVLDGVARGRGGWLETVNLDILRQWHGSEQVRELFSGADLLVADGMPLVWAGGLQGSPLPERVAGSALILSLTADAAAAELIRACPHLRVAGTLCPPFGFDQDPVWLERIARVLEERAPDIVYVGLGCPKQERLISLLRRRLPKAWFVSCGGSFNFVAGDIPRAPAAMQRLGLEWLHRLAKEPRRLYRRYLFTGIPFLVQLMLSAVAFRLSHPARAAR